MADKSYLNLPAAFPVGIRRNNPGNLKKGKLVAYPGLTDRNDTGRGPQFYAFKTMAYGMRAMIALVLSRIVKQGCTTIAKLGPKYTNPKVDDTAYWVKLVGQFSGINPNAILTTDHDTMKKLVLAIARKECGPFPRHENGKTATIDGQDFEDGWALLQTPAPLA